MKRFYFMALILGLTFASFEKVQARGGSSNWLLGIDLSYLAAKSETTVSGVTTVGSNQSTTFYDLTLGYLLGDNLYVGGIYSTKNYSDKGASISTSTSGNAMGASIGWVFGSGFHITGSYFFSATEGEYKKGSGTQADLGWRSFIAGSFYVGAKLTMRTLKYTEYAPTAGFESTTTTNTLPYISLGFGF